MSGRRIPCYIWWEFGLCPRKSSNAGRRMRAIGRSRFPRRLDVYKKCRSRSAYAGESVLRVEQNAEGGTRTIPTVEASTRYPLSKRIKRIQRIKVFARHTLGTNRNLNAFIDTVD